MKRLVVIPAIVLLALVAGTGCGNAYVFDQHVQKLEREWQQEQAVGVSAAELAPLRTQLAGLEARRMGPVPTSNALVGDPFARLEQQTRQVHGEAMNRSRSEAQTALQSLKQAYGPTPFTEDSADQQQLAKASEPGQLQQLSRTWTQHAAGVAQARDQLASKSGGLANGLPTDITTGLDQVQRDIDQAKQLNLWTAPGEGAVQGASTYLSQSYDAMLAQHDGTAKQLQDAAG
ncbi:MAG: hypothetical protein LBJ87_06300, partial [bacterium]|nr:hypothetical protein [bacterium]